MRTLARILAAIAIAAFSVGPVSAATPGTITGKVVDGAGKPLGGVRVGITGPKSTEVTTKPDGTYRVDVPPGLYSVTIAAPGFQSTQQDNVAVFSGESVTLATTLIAASLAEIAHVTVGSSSTAVSNSAASSERLSVATIRSQGQDQVVNLLDQLPGVEVLRVGGGSNEPGSNASISIRGAQPYESQVLIDGHPVDTIGNGAYGFNTTFINSILLSGVEVSKGPGNLPNIVTDAVGGTVNFQTAPITSKPSGELMTQADSFGGWTYGVRFSDTIGKFGFLVGVARETTPGYMNPQYIFGFGRASFFSPYTSPTYPLTGNNQVYPSGTSYVGVLNYNYLATSDFSNHSQLFKLAYNFSPVTSIQLSNYSTQTWLDETGNNVGNIYATIVPCISTYPAAPTCTTGPGVVNYNQNWTNQAFTNYIGQTVPINLYAGYPNTYETDNEPITTADLRTVIGPGTFLARYYAGSITRDVIQNNAFSAIGPCFTPACAWVGNIPGSATNPDSLDNGYSGEAYYEETTDVLHGFDAQYNIPFGDTNYITIGFDNHGDSYNFQELYANGWYPPCVTQSCAYALYQPSAQYLKVDNTTESVRGDFLLTPKLQLEFGGYASNTTYVGSRFDPRGGLTYRPTSNLSFRASAGSAYVTPYEGLINPTAYVSKKTFYPASQFSAETSMGYDFGVDFQYSRDSIVSADYYSTNIFNRYATVDVATSGTYNGEAYTSEVIPTSQGQTLNEGLEFTLLHQPKVGLGYHVAVDLLRDYFYDQTDVPLKNFGGVFLGPLPDNGVQLPGYPFSKLRYDLWYQFADGRNVRLGATTFGPNNSFGQPGFTVVDGALKLPVGSSFDVTLGASNILNKDNYATGGIYFGGYTYQALGGGIGPTNWEYATPQTVYLQLSKAISW
ncbi:MAG TPA: TonB-dependent receptor [Verrucomicrobiae bacterium]|nr:TonB-dependent receptor [Verrucomicrobiae bacterium]